MFNTTQNQGSAIQHLLDLLEQGKQHHNDLRNMLSHLSAQLEKKGPKETIEVVTFSNSPYTFQSQDYPYNGLYVGSAQTINVEYNTIQYTISLSAGFNQVNIPDGATITTPITATPISFSAVFVRQTLPLKL